jgi:hypothetical protein
VHPDAYHHTYTAAYRSAELQEEARRARLVRDARQARPARPSRARRRLGWTLVAVGLRLAVPAAR